MCVSDNAAVCIAVFFICGAGSFMLIDIVSLFWIRISFSAYRSVALYYNAMPSQFNCCVVNGFVIFAFDSIADKFGVKRFSYFRAEIVIVVKAINVDSCKPKGDLISFKLFFAIFYNMISISKVLVIHFSCFVRGYIS